MQVRTNKSWFTPNTQGTAFPKTANALCGVKWWQTHFTGSNALCSVTVSGTAARCVDRAESRLRPRARREPRRGPAAGAERARHRRGGRRAERR